MADRNWPLSLHSSLQIVFITVCPTNACFPDRAHRGWYRHLWTNLFPPWLYNAHTTAGRMQTMTPELVSHDWRRLATSTGAKMPIKLSVWELPNSYVCYCYQNSIPDKTDLTGLRVTEWLATFQETIREQIVNVWTQHKWCMTIFCIHYKRPAKGEEMALICLLSFKAKYYA